MTSTPSHSTDGPLLDALLDSWRRNNLILVNLLRALPEDAMDLRAVDGSQTVHALFIHMHYCRLVFVHEVAPELGVTVPEGEWRGERDRDRIEAMPHGSADAVREAVFGMLPKNKLRDRMTNRLLIYKDGKHPHEAQNPETIAFASLNAKNVRSL